MTDRALTFVEIDVPYCSLTYGLGACEARITTATNILERSEAFGTSPWALTRATISADAVAAPDGATTADKLADDGVSNSTGYVRQNVTWPGSENYVFSVFLQAADATTASIAIIDSGGYAGFISINLATGAVSSTSGGSYVSSGIEGVGGGWYRAWVAATPSAGGGSVRIEVASSGTGTAGFYLWGAQAETGTTPTGYIPTTTTATARTTTGSIKCFNSLGTCQDRANFDNDPVTMRFAKDAAYLAESGIEVVAASVESVIYSPAIISLGEDLGQRASLTVTFKDHRHSDTGAGFDKYPADRTYDPFTQGTFWGKFRARHPYLRGRPMRLIQGLLGEAIGDMDTRHFLIESFEGPTLDGRFTITAKDALKLADGDRAQAPVLSKGSLNAGITDSETSATLSPAGIGNTDYPASGYLNIGGKEIVSFTRSSDTLTITRAQEGTTAVAHSAGDRCQLCLHYSADDPADIIYDLLTTYAGVAASYITLADWQAETAAYYRRVNTAMIAEPTSVRQLVTELIQQVGLVIWWDDLNQKIRLQVLRSIATDAETFDDSNIIEGSLSVAEQPGKRISQVWTFFGLKTPLSPLDEPSAYRSSALTSDLDAEENDGAKLKKIFSRWIPFGGSSAAERVNDIQLGRFVTAPRKVTFELFRRGAETPTLGEGVRVESLTMQDATGEYANVPAQIVQLKPDDTVWRVTVEEMLFVDLSDEDLTTKTLTIDSNSYNVNLRTLYDANYATPAVGDEIVCNINAGVIVGSTSTATRAFDVGSWDSVAATGDRTNGSPVISSLSINTTTEGITAGMFVRGTGIPNGTKVLSVDSTTQVTLDANCTSTGTGGSLTFYTQIITVNVRGRVQGKGGKGGASDGAGDPDGLDGGDSFYTRYPVNLSLDTGDAEIWSGGGGGGGTASAFGTYGGAGGGGAGSEPGSAGDNNPAEEFYGPASPGTTEAGGAGGAADGGTFTAGDGGDPGQAGGSPNFSNASNGSPGAAGVAIDGVSYVKKTGAGDIRGSETN